MRIKDQTIYEISTDKFKYLKRKENKVLYRVDINELNKRLERENRSNFYTTVLFTILCFSILFILSLLSIKF